MNERRVGARLQWSCSSLVQDAESWGLKLEALKLIQIFVQYFSKIVGPHLPSIMAQAWQLFVTSLPVYQELVISNIPDVDAEQAGAALHPVNGIDKLVAFISFGPADSQPLR